MWDRVRSDHTLQSKTVLQAMDSNTDIQLPSSAQPYVKSTTASFVCSFTPSCSPFQADQSLRGFAHEQGQIQRQYRIRIPSKLQDPPESVKRTSFCSRCVDFVSQTALPNTASSAPSPSRASRNVRCRTTSSSSSGPRDTGISTFPAETTMHWHVERGKEPPRLHRRLRPHPVLLPQGVRAEVRHLQLRRPLGGRQGEEAPALLWCRRTTP